MGRRGTEGAEQGVGSDKTGEPQQNPTGDLNCPLNHIVRIARWRISVVSLLQFVVMKYRVLLEQDEDGIFVATCPSLPGWCVTGG